ncbi:MAG: type II toxin-antitoxin system YafQ family toxin [Candidatus Egerieousia sp.]
MKTVISSSKFKKDLRKYRSKPETLKKLYEVVCILEKGANLPKRYKPHMLIGDYKGYMECHIENDTLLIWLDEEENIIKLIRFGTHSELFK